VCELRNKKDSFFIQSSWSIEEEKQLRPLLESKKYVNVIAEALGKTVDSVKSKMRRLGLKEEDIAKKKWCLLLLI
jgi:hypothetical protein